MNLAIYLLVKGGKGGVGGGGWNQQTMKENKKLSY